MGERLRNKISVTIGFMTNDIVKNTKQINCVMYIIYTICSFCLNFISWFSVASIALMNQY